MTPSRENIQNYTYMVWKCQLFQNETIQATNKRFQATCIEPFHHFTEQPRHVHGPKKPVFQKTTTTRATNMESRLTEPHVPDHRSSVTPVLQPSYWGRHADQKPRAPAHITNLEMCSVCTMKSKEKRGPGLCFWHCAPHTKKYRITRGWPKSVNILEYLYGQEANLGNWRLVWLYRPCKIIEP